MSGCSAADHSWSCNWPSAEEGKVQKSQSPPDLASRCLKCVFATRCLHVCVCVAACFCADCFVCRVFRSVADYGVKFHTHCIAVGSFTCGQTHTNGSTRTIRKQSEKSERPVNDCQGQKGSRTVAVSGLCDRCWLLNALLTGLFLWKKVTIQIQQDWCHSFPFSHFFTHAQSRTAWILTLLPSLLIKPRRVSPIKRPFFHLSPLPCFSPLSCSDLFSSSHACSSYFTSAHLLLHGLLCTRPRAYTCKHICVFARDRQRGASKGVRLNAFIAFLSTQKYDGCFKTERNLNISASHWCCVHLVRARVYVCAYAQRHWRLFDLIVLLERRLLPCFMTGAVGRYTGSPASPQQSIIPLSADKRTPLILLLPLTLSETFKTFSR